MNNTLSAWAQQLVGGGLVLTGGIVAQGMRVRFDKKQEIESIKVSIMDELHEIRAIVSSMSETHRTTGNVPQTYFNELLENEESFKLYKPRLFLISHAELRRSICDFYKKLDTLIKKSREAVGTLKDDAGQTARESDVIEKFQALGAEAVVLEKLIAKYAYKPLYIF